MTGKAGEGNRSPKPREYFRALRNNAKGSWTAPVLLRICSRRNLSNNRNDAGRTYRVKVSEKPTTEVIVYERVK